MHNATIFKEQIRLTFKETYDRTVFLESLRNKKELTLAEAVYILSIESQLLTEGLFSKMGGLVDKGIETIANKIVGAKESIVNWAITKLGGQIVKKPEPTPFDGASTILPIAKMAKDDQPGFFAKVAKMTGNTAKGVKELYMKLEDLYTKIPLIGGIVAKIPKGWRTVVLAIIVIIIVAYCIWKNQHGGPDIKPDAPASGAHGAGNSDVSNAKDMIGANVAGSLDPAKVGDLVNSASKMGSTIDRLSAAIASSKDPETATRAIGYLEKVLKITEQQLTKPGLESIGTDKMEDILNVGGQHVDITGFANLKEFLMANKDKILDTLDTAKAVLKGGSASDMAGAGFSALDRAIK